MSVLLTIGAVAAVLAVLVLGVCYLCFRMAFYSENPPVPEGEIPTPEGEIYDPYRDKMKKWILEARQLPQEDVSITSFDGLTLRGKFYPYAPNAPIELMFHGYRGNAERDMSGGVQRCFALGRSALIVDQRASGRSEGHVISFGINERKDCLKWVEFMVEHFGPDVKIILTGISMGAATVLMASGEKLPPNVVGVLADCGYSSAKDIMKLVIREMKLPPNLCYPFVKLAARIYGHFDLEDTSPVEAMRKARVPIIFYHGEADDFVPCSMSKECFDACIARKAIVTIPGAGHGLSYPKDPETYLQTLFDFFGPEASAQ